MGRLLCLIMSLFIVAFNASYADEINYSNCQSLQDVIVQETREIQNTNLAEHKELAHLHMLRAGSYTLAGASAEALDDIQTAYTHGRYCNDWATLVEVALNGSFFEVLNYDKLKMTEECDAALKNFQEAANLVGCPGCHDCQNDFQHSSNTFHFSDLIKNCKHKSKKPSAPSAPAVVDDYSDILGPNVIDPGWCEETVVGTAAAMMAIANQIDRFGVKVAVIGTIECLKERGLKCCRSGNFWKACVAPIARKWQKLKTDWEDRIIRDGYLLDPLGGSPCGF